MSRYSSPGHALSSNWWNELRRMLRVRPEPPPEPGPEGLGALFVRKRTVLPQEIITCYIHSMQYLPHIADRLKNARPVVLNLEELSEADQRRALDFISGVAYALDSSYERAGDSVFLFVPGNVTLVDEE